MYLGVIIVFTETTTDLEFLMIKEFIHSCSCKICLINNGYNKDFEIKLQELEHLYKNIEVLTIRKSKNINTAVKLGTRFLNSIFNFNLIVFLESTDANKLNQLTSKLSEIKSEKEKYTPISTRSKRGIFNHVFSIKEFYSKVI